MVVCAGKCHAPSRVTRRVVTRVDYFFFLVAFLTAFFTAFLTVFFFAAICYLLRGVMRLDMESSHDHTRDTCNMSSCRGMPLRDGAAKVGEK